MRTLFCNRPDCLNVASVSRVRIVCSWIVLAFAVGLPLEAAITSPLLAWREPVYVLAGFAGVFALALMLFQPLLAAGTFPGLSKGKGRRLHRWTGSALVLSVLIHVAGLWVTSPPDVIDALLFNAPTPFSVWGVVAMWGVFAVAFLVAFRRRLGFVARTWRLTHKALAVCIVIASVAHAVMIEGTMETWSKSMLCVLILVVTINVLSDFSLLKQLTRMRLRWYAYCTGQLIRKHWQWAVLALALVPIGLSAVEVLLILASPLLALSSPQLAIIPRFLILLGVCCTALVWVYPQRQAILGGEATDYFQTLPLSRGIRQASELILLLLVTSLLFFPFIVAIFFAESVSLNFKLLTGFCHVILICSILSLQYGVLRHNRYWITGSVISLLFVGVSLHVSATESSIQAVAYLLLGASMGGLGWLFLVSPVVRQNRKSAPLTHPASSLGEEAWLTRQCPGIWIILHCLIEHKASTLFRLLITVALALGACKLFELLTYDNRSILVAILALTLIAAIISSFYRTLFAAHRCSQAYQAALFSNRLYWPVRDTATVSALALMPALIVLAPLFHRGWLTPIRVGIVLLAYQLLLILLRLIALRGGKHTIVLTSLGSALWAVLLIQLIT